MEITAALPEIVSESIVYIADDCESDRRLLESALKRLGFETRSFTTGQAIHNAVRMAQRPVLALLDWLMPDGSGVDICQAIKENPPPIPVYSIIVTSQTDTRDIAFALEKGADDFIAKPYSLLELRARIRVGKRLLAFHKKLLDSNARLLEHTKHVEALADARAKQLVRADRLSTLGVLSAGMAHEINNPASFLAVNIQTLSENLEGLNSALSDGSTPEDRQKARRFVSVIPEILLEMRSGVARIRSIVNGLKAYAHPTSGERTWFTVESRIESALHLCENRLKYHVTVRKDFSPTSRVYGDPYQIDQVLINLFTNAADAIEEHEGEGNLRISTEQDDGKVFLRIHDSGKGIPPAMIEKVFTPFYTTKPVGKGTGLGLSISRSIVEDHKGELTVENHPQGGALFIIALPAEEKS